MKEVLIPVEAFNVSVGLTDNLSADVFYQFNFKETAVDPVGTYFSETDLFADGGNTAYRDFSGTAAEALIPAYTAIGNGQGALGALLPTAQAAGLYQQGVNFSPEFNT